MTRRSLFLAFIGVVLLSLTAFYNDMVLKNTHLVGNFLPVSVFGTLVLWVMILNPLLSWARRDWSLNRTELAAIVGIALFACYPVGRGLGHYFTTFLMMPHHWARTTPGWQASPARLAPTDVPDAEALRRALAEALDRRPPGDPLRVVAERLAPDLLHADAADPLRARELVQAVADTLADPRWIEAVRLDTLPQPLSIWVRTKLRRGPDRLTAEERAALQRDLFDLAAGDLVKPRQPGVLERVPPQLLADPSEDASVSLDGFVTGLGRADTVLEQLKRIPWRAWRSALLFWIPLLFTFSVLVTGVALVLHRQWADHEHLPYATVEFARSVLPSTNAPGGPVLRERLFWVGFLPVLMLHLINYANAWFPDYVVPVQRQLNFTPLLEILPTMQRGNPWGLFNPTIYFTTIGFAYFLPSDVSLSLGVAPYVFCLLAGILAGYGISFGAGYLQPSIETSLYTGAAFAMFLTILYSGRHYLQSTFARALGLPVRDRVESSAIWGARLALIAFVAAVAQLVRIEIEWPLAVVYTLLTVMIFTVMSRLLAESGVFFFKPNIFACIILWNFMGSQALGPEQLLSLTLISSLLLIDPRECLMPFAVTGLKIGDDAGVRLGRLARTGLIATLTALVIATTASLFFQYRDGAIQTGDGWTHTAVPRLAININVSVVQELVAQGALDSARAIRGWERFRNMAPKSSFLIPFGSAFVAVLLFTLLRHRFARFPLHPVLFLFGMIYEARMMGFSFLIGCMVKSFITRYGGAKSYQWMKPLMIGLVAGELMASLVPLVIGILYSAIAGRAPIPFRILPG